MKRSNIHVNRIPRKRTERMGRPIFELKTAVYFLVKDMSQEALRTPNKINIKKRILKRSIVKLPKAKVEGKIVRRPGKKGIICRKKERKKAYQLISLK